VNRSQGSASACSPEPSRAPFLRVRREAVPQEGYAPARRLVASNHESKPTTGAPKKNGAPNTRPLQRPPPRGTARQHPVRRPLRGVVQGTALAEYKGRSPGWRFLWKQSLSRNKLSPRPSLRPRVKSRVRSPGSVSTTTTGAMPVVPPEVYTRQEHPARRWCRFRRGAAEGATSPRPWPIRERPWDRGAARRLSTFLFILRTYRTKLPRGTLHAVLAALRRSTTTFGIRRR
jgi:hypothetical protein